MFALIFCRYLDPATMGLNKPAKAVQKVEVVEVEEPATPKIEYAYTFGEFQLEYLYTSGIAFYFLISC